MLKIPRAAVTACLLVTFCMAGFWAAPFALAQGSKQLRLCHNSNIDSATDRASRRFAEAVEKKTGGQVKVMIYPRNQLGGNRELLEQVKMGSLDMTLMGLGTMGYMVDEYNFMQLPFAFRSQEHIYKVLDSDMGKSFEKRVADQGFVFLSQRWDRLPRHIAGKRAIVTTKDLQGLKVREGTPAFHEGIRVFGASPVKINLNEMYIALQQGIADAVELPLDYVFDYSIHETAKFLSLTYHTYGTQFIAMNKKGFDSLTPEVRKSLMDAAGEAGDFNNQLTWSQEDDYMKKIEKAGVRINKPEHGQFVQVLQANIAAVEKKWPACKGLFEKIQAVK
ncbi:MAG TPA: TRAP transporter substrate-binding protein [Thermodesulfobacteriota bacterium]|nr:TRAP transporter substrate-binding protein [Thermodesulfobacteriota bacterium]